MKDLMSIDVGHDFWHGASARGCAQIENEASIVDAELTAFQAPKQRDTVGREETALTAAEKASSYRPASRNAPRSLSVVLLTSKKFLLKSFVQP